MLIKSEASAHFAEDSCLFRRIINKLHFMYASFVAHFPTTRACAYTNYDFAGELNILFQFKVLPTKLLRHEKAKAARTLYKCYVFRSVNH